MKKRLFICLFACCLAASWATAQTSRPPDKFSTATAGADLLVGSVFFKEEPKAATVVGVNVWTRLGCLERRPWCWVFETDIWWRRPIDDPWRRRPPIIIWPPLPIPPTPDPWTDFPIEQVKLGRSLVVSPSLGLQFGGEKFKMTLFGGGGFQHTEGAETVLNGKTYRSMGGTSPLVSYGASARYFLKSGISVRAQAGAMRVFEGNLNVVGPDGSIGVWEGMASTIPMIAAGVGFGLR